MGTVHTGCHVALLHRQVAAHFAALRKRSSASESSKRSKKREAGPLMQSESTASWHEYMKHQKSKPNKS